MNCCSWVLFLGCNFKTDSKRKLKKTHLQKQHNWKPTLIGFFFFFCLQFWDRFQNQIEKPNSKITIENQLQLLLMNICFCLQFWDPLSKPYPLTEKRWRCLKASIKTKKKKLHASQKLKEMLESFQNSFFSENWNWRNWCYHLYAGCLGRGERGRWRSVKNVGERVRSRRSFCAGKGLYTMLSKM